MQNNYINNRWLNQQIDMSNPNIVVCNKKKGELWLMNWGKNEAKKMMFLGFKNISKNAFLKTSPFSGGVIFSVLSFTLLALRKLLIPK